MHSDCWQILKAGRELIYIPYVEEIGEIKRYALNESEYNKRMDLWKKCEVLYIDDLFKRLKFDDNGKANDADIRIMFELIDYRTRNNLQTIISSEFSLIELMKIDEAVAGRIKENCGRWIFMTNKNPQNNYRMRDGV